MGASGTVAPSMQLGRNGTPNFGDRRLRPIDSGMPTRMSVYEVAVGWYCDSGSTIHQSKPEKPLHKRSQWRNRRTVYRLLAHTRRTEQEGGQLHGYFEGPKATGLSCAPGARPVGRGTSEAVDRFGCPIFVPRPRAPLSGCQGSLCRVLG